MKLRVRPLAAAATLVIVGAATATAFWPASTPRSTAKSFYLTDPEHGVEGWREWPQAQVTAEPDEEGAYGDDPRRRMINNWALFGRPGAAARAQLALEAEREAQRLISRRDTMSMQKAYGDPMAAAPLPTDFGEQWTSIGPRDAEFQWNGSTYLEVDSGRITSLAVDPNDTTGRTIFASTAGGGVWKADQFAVNNDRTTPSGQRPNWTSLTDRIGNQAVGAFAVAPSNPAVLYVGSGDPFDTEGGQLFKSTDGGGSWTTLSARLTATDPSNTAKKHDVRTIRDLKVDPADSTKVLVATDMGLFRSTDGAAFTHVDLPNAGGKLLMEATWSIAYLGTSRWAISGVLACQPGRLPPTAGAGLDPGENIPNTDPSVVIPCEGGNPGDIWLTTDGGATWASLSTAGALPTVGTGAGRMTLAAGTPAGASTVVYAMVATRNDSAGVGVWRSTNGAQSFVNATGSVSIGVNDCNDPAVGSAQSWYNHAIAVDPTDNNNVIMGGMLCGMRTRSGLSGSPTWEVVAHWLPSGGGGGVPGGSVDYVHADWHRAMVVRVNGVSRVIVGTDGGVSYSDNLFTAGNVTEIVWHGANRGIATHLPYSVGSGDPATGNPYFVMTGLQDNGTRLRDRSNGPDTFNQVIGGDGLGSAIVGTRSGKMTLFGSVNGRRQYCNPDANGAGCDDGGAFKNTGVDLFCTGDVDPFLIRYAPALRDPRGRVVTTASYRRFHRSNGADEPKFTAISPCLASDERPEANGGHIIRDISVAQHKDGVFGAALSGGRAAVTGNCPAGADPATCTWHMSGRLWIDLNGNATREKEESVFFTNDVAFPPGPTGMEEAKTYVVASGAPETEAETPVPAELGHVFRTTDFGATFTNISGDLPNVPVHAVLYDPVDLTNQTIYAGTDLGLYVTRNGGANWTRVGGESLPFVKVTDIFLSQSGGMMRVATYGRGLWELHPGAVTSATAGNGDYDRNGHVDFFDVAQLASRLGTTPATTEQPVYERNLNTSGTLPLLDDTDLTTVLFTVTEGQP